MVIMIWNDSYYASTTTTTTPLLNNPMTICCWQGRWSPQPAERKSVMCSLKKWIELCKQFKTPLVSAIIGWSKCFCIRSKSVSPLQKFQRCYCSFQHPLLVQVIVTAWNQLVLSLSHVLIRKGIVEHRTDEPSLSVGPLHWASKSVNVTTGTLGVLHVCSMESGVKKEVEKNRGEKTK